MVESILIGIGVVSFLAWVMYDAYMTDVTDD
jgi:hypothetical protein